MKKQTSIPWRLIALFLIFNVAHLRSSAMEQVIENNGLNIWCESFGNKTKPALLLVAGGGCQGIMWPKEFCEQLAQHFFVMRYDHRDVGLSSRIDFNENPYDLMDMTHDALTVLDHFGIKQTYVFGTSMGGVITQLLAAYFPERVKAAFIMSSTSDLSGLVAAIEGLDITTKLPLPSQEYLSWIKGIVNNPAETQEEKIEQHLSGWRLLNGAVFPFDEETYRQLIVDQGKRQGASEDGVGNHIRAIKAWLNKKQLLPQITVPTYVFWGDQDLIFSIEHPQSILDSVENGELFVINGMGHNLNKAVYDFIISTNLKFVN